VWSMTPPHDCSPMPVRVAGMYGPEPDYVMEM
jgi:hypothetical protein